MARVIAVFNQSGGVGKTTLTTNVGYHLGTGRARQKILLIDLDPQGTLTTFMGFDPYEQKVTSYELLTQGIIEPLQKDGVGLIPANRTLADIDLRLTIDDPETLPLLREALDPILEEYEFILIDCPPSLGILSCLALVAATHVLVPIEAQFKATQGTDLLLDTMTRMRSMNPKLQFAGFVPTRYDDRNSQDKRRLKQLKELGQLATVFPAIPKTTLFPDSSEEGKSLAEYSPKHPAVKIFKKIASTLRRL